MLNLIHRYKSLPRVAKSTIWFTFCNFLLLGLGFITGPIFTRILIPEEYGRLTLFLSYEQIILVLCTWEIYSGGYQKGLFKYDDEKPFSARTLVLMNLITTLCFFLVLLFESEVREFTEISSLNLLLIYIYLLCFPAYQMWTIRNRKAYVYEKVVPLTIFYTIASIIASLLAVYFISATANVKFSATLISSIAICAIFYIKTLSGLNFSIDNNTKQQIKFLVAYQLPLVLHSLSYFVLNQADRVMIGKMIGNSEAAFYGVAYTIASTVGILQNSLNQSLTPWRYQKLKDREFKQVKDSTNVLLILVGGFILCILIIIPEVMKLLFTEDYYQAVWCVPPVAAGVYFMFLYSIFVSIESYYEKTTYIMMVSISCGILNIALNYICIPRFGYVSSAYTTLVSYILFSLLHYAAARKVMKHTGGISSAISSTAVILISAGFLICTFAIMALYNTIWVRYILVMIILCIFLVKRRMIIDKVKMYRNK